MSGGTSVAVKQQTALIQALMGLKQDLCVCPQVTCVPSPDLIL